jgi:methylated-DNA-[protein]-cysteine S-methyltransferase
MMPLAWTVDADAAYLALRARAQLRRRTARPSGLAAVAGLRRDAAVATPGDPSMIKTPLPARAPMAHPRALVAQARVDTPLGPVLLAATARGLAGLWFDGQAHHPGPLAVPVAAGHPVLAQARAELDAYWRDGAAGFETPVDAHGTTFQQRVWQALRGIAAGRTTSYGALAAALGCPTAARAVAAAVGRNPVAIVVPCHRVLGHDGALRGYAGGLARKRALLALEAAAQRVVTQAGDDVASSVADSA